MYLNLSPILNVIHHNNLFKIQITSLIMCILSIYIYIHLWHPHLQNIKYFNISLEYIYSSYILYS